MVCRFFATSRLFRLCKLSGTLVCFAAAAVLSGPPVMAAPTGFSEPECGASGEFCEPSDWLEAEADTCSWVTVRAGALTLHRSGNQANTMLTDQSTGQTLVSTADVDPEWTAGAELDVILRLTEDWDFEFDWFTLGNWSREYALAAGPYNVNQFPVPISTAQVFSSSNLHNFEFNLRYRATDRLTWLGGFRYLELEDYFGLHFAEGAVNGISQDAMVEQRNRLYGFQLGAQAVLWRAGAWEIDGWVKAGIFGNAARSSADVAFTGAPITLPPLRASESSGAFVGDLGLRATRQFGQHLQLYGGYRVMMLNGVALATSQVPNVTEFFAGGPATVETNGTPFYHGAELGLVLSY